MAAPSRRVLVVGGGPAGSVTAFWLAKAGFEVLVVERSTDRAYGQGIDITGPAIEVVRKMGLEEEIRSRTTKEGGFAIVNDEGQEMAAIGVAPVEGGTVSITREIEIMRGDITDIFTNAADACPNVKYRYGCSVTAICQSEDSVTAVFSDNGQTEEFAAIIGADGIGSRVRKLTFDSAADADCYKPTDAYVAFYSIPGDPEYDIPKAHLQHGGGGRAIWMRPIDEKGSRASCYLLVYSEDADLANAAREGPIERQKEVLERMFRGFRGMGPRALRGLCDCDDFYFTRIVQVKLDSWHVGRCALVGDAGYCPSPLTGQGTTLAIMGAYILAGEMAKHPDDPNLAFKEYRRNFESFVKRSQVIPFGGLAPRMANPSSDWGVWLLRTLFCFVAWTGVWKWIDFGNESVKFQVPLYDFG